MPIDYEHLMSLRTRGERVSYTDREVLLYALGVGLGRDAASRDEYPFVVEHAGLRVLPTFASILATNTLLDDCGWDVSRVVPHEEAVSLERPLDDSGTLLVDTEVAGVFDKGAEAGALVVVESRARRERDGEAVFRVRRTWLARSDGGFGGARGASVAPPAPPDRPPDLLQVCETRPDQALLFRLSGDRNPLHVDPRVARDRGLPGPILHGLCLHGLLGYAVLRVICEYDHTLLRSISATYTGPVYPGETLVAELWQDGNIVSCRLRARDRNQVVLDNGRCLLAA